MNQFLEIPGIFQRCQRSSIIEIDEGFFYFFVAFNLLVNLFEERSIILRIKKPWNAMKTVIAQRCVDHSIIERNFGKADAAKSNFMFLQFCLDVFSPPAFMSKFNYIGK